MYLKWCLLVSSLIIALVGKSQFDESKLLKSNETPTYKEVLDFYEKYAQQHEDIALYNMGNSDYGLPIYLCVLNGEKDSTKTFLNARNGSTILINNGIHPGEPCGINASMQLVIEFSNMPEIGKKNFPTVGIITGYNVGGMKNRGAYSRANQDGPAEHGFRGNAQNLDLNRDFIKMDSENMWTFATIFHALDPDVFIDTHTTNGADYQYAMTYIVPLYDRMPKPTRDLLFDNMLPYLKENMPKKWNYDITPYVSMNGKTLDEGIHAFNPLPRYAMGYADLFNALSFTTEAHMLKPFEDRVRSTYAFLVETLAWMVNNGDEIEKARIAAFKEQLSENKYPVDFSYSGTEDSILFKGFEWTYKPSTLTEQERLFYDRDQPFERYIPHHFRYDAAREVDVPSYYVVGGQAKKVIAQLEANKVNFNRITSDTTILVNNYRVVNFESPTKPYEGHFLHSKVEIDQEQDSVRFKKGDILIPTNQRHQRFIVSVLDPRMEDSYFAWNFFDSYVQQKEYFSAYVFEESAEKLLTENPDLEKKFRAKQKEDTTFAENRWAQLYFLYKNSPYYEASHNVLPVFGGVGEGRR